MNHILKSTILAIGVLAFVTLGSAQTPEEQARALMEKYRPMLVVVTVKGKVVTSPQIDTKAQQRRTLGITVADNGLVAVSNSAIDATVGLAGQEAVVDGETVKLNSVKTEYSDIEISYGDKTLLHGKIIRQDVNADIAFILPDQDEAKKVNKTFSKVDLNEFAANAQPADQVVGLSRASSVYGYMPTLVMGRITGVFNGDRKFFVTTAGNSQGMPIFSLDGRPIGLTVVRVMDGQPTGILGTLSAGSIQVMANLALSSLEN